MIPEWLPPLVLLEDSRGNWDAYLEKLYSHFFADFVRTRPKWPRKRVGLKRFPEHKGKAATFWHFISDGPEEKERLCDLRRCERIRWPRRQMESFVETKPTDDANILWWKSRRGTNESYVLALPDFTYVVVVADRGDHVLPWTAYCVDREHRQEKLRHEYETYWKAQKG